MAEPTMLDAYYFKDPYPLNAQLRAACPVSHVEMPNGVSAWMVTRYDDVQAVLNDKRLTKDWRKLVPTPSTDSPSEATALSLLSENMLSMDPPDHTRLRKLVSKAFTARRVENLRPRVEAVTEALLDDMSAHGDDEIDMVESFAFPLPFVVICELLGVPESDRDKFRTWAQTFGSSVATAKEHRTAAAEVMEYFSGLLALRRADAESRDDLLTALLHTRDNEDMLTETELIALVILLVNAGHETTHSLIALGMLTLMGDPAVKAKLSADHTLVPAAVEELLRYISPISHSTMLFTLEPTTIAGTEIPAEQAVIASISSANRDPSRFASPDVFDLERDTGGHLAFGHGKHFCMGAALARLEAEVAFTGLLHRFPRMVLAVPEHDLTWKPNTFIRGPVALPVRLHG